MAYNDENDIKKILRYKNQGIYNLVTQPADQAKKDATDKLNAYAMALNNAAEKAAKKAKAEENAQIQIDRNRAERAVLQKLNDITRVARAQQNADNELSRLEEQLEESKTRLKEKSIDRVKKITKRLQNDEFNARNALEDSYDAISLAKRKAAAKRNNIYEAELLTNINKLAAENIEKNARLQKKSALIFATEQEDIEKRNYLFAEEQEKKLTDLRQKNIDLISAHEQLEWSKRNGKYLEELQQLADIQHNEAESQKDQLQKDIDLEIAYRQQIVKDKNDVTNAQTQKKIEQTKTDTIAEQENRHFAVKKNNELAIETLNYQFEKTLTEIETERLNRRERAELTSRNKIQELTLQIEKNQTEIETERLNRREKAELASQNKLQELKLQYEKELSATVEERLNREERAAQSIRNTIQSNNNRREAAKSKAEEYKQIFNADGTLSTQGQAVVQSAANANRREELNKLDEESLNDQIKSATILATMQNKANAEEYLLHNKRAIAAKKEAEFNEKAMAELTKRGLAMSKAYADVSKEKKRAERIEKNLKTKEKREDRQKASAEFTDEVFGKGKTLNERLQGLDDAFHDTENGTGKFDLGKGLAVLADFVQSLNDSVDAIAKYKSIVDTRLQGTSSDVIAKKLIGGSYWEKMAGKTTKVAAAGLGTFTQKAYEDKIVEYVQKGITFDLEQRAFLGTIKDKIADTFDATNSTLMRLVRIQQADTTAARLGMESALTAFLNNMYATTEYMTDMAASVKSNLEESMALMDAKLAVGYEYQVQKWAGSMYSVGMSNAGVSAITDALGKLTSGDLSGIESGGASNLLIMAANKANLSLTEILEKGTTDEQVNTLLNSVVSYLQELKDEVGENRVVQQELAKVYGLKASDIQAITNLTADNTLENISKSYLSYNNAISQLQDMTGSMILRTSMGEILTNIGENLKNSLANELATSPVLYGIYKVAGLLNDLVGGIAIPAVSVAGFGVDLETTVADLMSVAALSGSLLKASGKVIAGVASALVGGGTEATLKLAGIEGSNLRVITRGSGKPSGNPAQGESTSESGAMVGNASGTDVQEKTMADADSEKDSQMAKNKDEREDATTTDINDNVIKIFDLLQSVVDGGSALHVTVDNYGMTNTSGLN